MIISPNPMAWASYNQIKQHLNVITKKVKKPKTYKINKMNINIKPLTNLRTFKANLAVCYFMSFDCN